MTRKPGFDLAAELAKPGFTPAQRDAPALVDLVASADEAIASRAAPALASLKDIARRAIAERLAAARVESAARVEGLPAYGGRVDAGAKPRSDPGRVDAGAKPRIDPGRVDAGPKPRIDAGRVDGAKLPIDAGAQARLVGVIGLLAKAGDGDARAMLFERMSDAEVRVRRAAASALGKLEGADVRAALFARWDASDVTADERRVLVEALGKLGGDDVLVRLRALEPGGDVELARRRDRAVLMADRSAKRDEDSAVVVDVAPPTPVTVRLGCRAGLAELLVEELAAIGIAARALVDREVELELAKPLSTLFASHLWATLAVRVPFDAVAALDTRGTPEARDDVQRGTPPDRRDDVQRGTLDNRDDVQRGAPPDRRDDVQRDTLDNRDDVQRGAPPDRRDDVQRGTRDNRDDVQRGTPPDRRDDVQRGTPHDKRGAHDNRDVPVDMAAALTRAITARPVRDLLRAWTRGPIRWRLGFASGHKRSIVWRVARDVTAAAPELVNDPTATTWDILVDELPATADARPADARRTDSRPTDSRADSRADARPASSPAVSLSLVPRRLADPRFAWRVAEIPAGSHPSVAAALVWLAGLRDEDRVWDPFCGSALELIERAQRGRYGRLVGTDIDDAALVAARANADAARANAAAEGRDGFGPDIEFVRGDARSYSPGPVDLVMTNPPLGSRVQLDAVGLLVEALPNFVKQLAPKGRLVWITPATRKTSPACEQLGLRRTRWMHVDLGGVRGHLERWEKP